MTRAFTTTGLVVAGLALSVSVPAFAQPSNPASEQVLQTERAWTEALLRSDLPALRRIYADDLVYVHSGGNVETKSVFLSRVEKGGLRYHHMRLIEPKVRVYGDTAVVNGAFEVKVDSDGQPVEAKVVYIHVYVRQNTGWRMVAHQTTRVAAR